MGEHEELSEPRQLTAYIDDSGSHGQAAHFILAGYVAAPERWDAFATAWKHFLTDGPRSLAYIKATEAAGLRKQFGGWSRSERDAKLHQAAELISAHAEFAVITTLSRQNYDEIVRSYVDANKDEFLEGRPLFNSYYSPYVLLLSRLLPALVHESIKRQARISYVMDSQPEKATLVQHMFDLHARRATEIWVGPRGLASLGSLRFATEQEEVALQAADLLAWNVNRNLEKGRIEGVRSVFGKLTQVPTLRFPDNPVAVQIARQAHSTGIDLYSGERYAPPAINPPF